MRLLKSTAAKNIFFQRKNSNSFINFREQSKFFKTSAREILSRNFEIFVALLKFTWIREIYKIFSKTQAKRRIYYLFKKIPRKLLQIREITWVHVFENFANSPQKPQIFDCVWKIELILKSPITNNYLIFLRLLWIPAWRPTRFRS